MDTRYIEKYSVFSIKIICIWTILVLLLSVALYSVSTIDRTKIRDNAIESLDILRKEGDYYRYPIGGPMLQKDNYTDAIMIGCAYCKDPTKSEIDNVFSSPSICTDSTLTRTEGTYMTVSSSDILTVEDISYYPRYWHGYLTTLRPLLLILNLKGIRILNYFILYGLALITLWLIWRKLGKFCTLSFFLALMITGFPLVPDTLQFVTTYMISLMASIITLSLPSRMLLKSRFGIFMFIIGGLTSYFDLLTTPVLTFGLPCTIALLLRNKFPDWKFIVFCGMMWCLGYVGIWSTKWILSVLFSSVNMIEDTKNALIDRSSIVITLDNMKGSHTVLIYTITLFFISFIASIFYGRLKHRMPLIKRYSGLAFIGLVPFIWTLSFQGHTFFHFWFVWRSFAVSVFALMIFYYKSFFSTEPYEKNCSFDSLL